MEYGKGEAKEYARKNMKGIWGASLTPFGPDYRIDEEGFVKNIRYCIEILGLDGMFLNGLMGEGFHQTISERKRLFKLAVDASQGEMAIMAYTSDSVLENVVEMTRYAEEIGADYVIMINPKFYFEAMTDEGVFQYYKYVAERVNIGIALFNQAEHGYLMSPDLISRIADLDNIVAIKDIAPASHIMRTRILCGDKIVVSDAFEENWFMNLSVRGQSAMIATVEPFCLQSRKSKLLKEYTDLALKGEISKAYDCYRQLEPIRRALLKVTVPGKIQATYKYWTARLGMAGGEGRVRLPQMELTDAEKNRIISAVEVSGLV